MSMFYPGDRVVVISHDPDSDFRERGEIPIGTVGFYLKDASEAENPETGEEEPTCWVDFDLPYEKHPWTTEIGTGIRACMFYSMLQPEVDEVFDASLDGLF